MVVMTVLHIETGDLTTYRVDAIVNAANNDLILGGGLAGAIRRAGGPEIQAHCNRIGPVRVGQAAITTAGDMPCKYVIHQASMSLGSATTADSLRTSTRAALELAEENEIKTLAFPAVGTGIAGFDTLACAEIMLGEIKKYLAETSSGLTDIYFVLFDERTASIFTEKYNEIFA